jgi:hypothetical protein
MQLSHVQSDFRSRRYGSSTMLCDVYTCKVLVVSRCISLGRLFSSTNKTDHIHLDIENMHTLPANIKWIWLEAGRTASFRGAFLCRFAASAKQFYIYRQCTYIVFILQCTKQLPYSPIKEETSVILIIFHDAVTVTYRRSTWIRYQKAIYWSVTVYNKKFPSLQFDSSNRTPQWKITDMFVCLFDGV